jgi:hypothetical protein
MHYELILGTIFIGFILYVFLKQTIQASSRLDNLARQNQTCRVLQTIPYNVSGKNAIFEIVNDSCESGMPHTTDVDTIRFPDWLWKKRDSNEFHKVLRHELIHLLQRRSPTAWRIQYKRWGYSIQKDPPVGIPSHIVERVRYNPDLADAPWAIYEDRYVTVACYKSTTNPQLRDTEIVIWDLDLGKQIDQMPDSWKWKGMHQAEHPHEISAEMGADVDHAPYVPDGFVEFLKTLIE